MWPIWGRQDPGGPQGLRKSFSVWGLNFKQFSAGFHFEMVGHDYKDCINKNKHVQHRCTSALNLWESNQKEKTNMKYMVYTLKKKSVFFFKSKYIFADSTPIRCFQNGSCLLLGNQGSMQGQQSRVHNGALVVSRQGNIKAWTRNLKKKINIDHLISLLEWAKGVKFIYLFIHFFNYSYNQTKSSILHWIIIILALKATLWMYTSLSSVSFGLI